MKGSFLWLRRKEHQTESKFLSQLPMENLHRLGLRKRNSDKWSMPAQFPAVRMADAKI